MKATAGSIFSPGPFKRRQKEIIISRQRNTISRKINTYTQMHPDQQRKKTERGSRPDPRCKAKENRVLVYSKTRQTTIHMIFTHSSAGGAPWAPRLRIAAPNNASGVPLLSGETAPGRGLCRPLHTPMRNSAQLREGEAHRCLCRW